MVHFPNIVVFIRHSIPENHSAKHMIRSRPHNEPHEYKRLKTQKIQYF